MSIKTNEIVKNFTEAMRNAGKEKTKPYDTSATVTKVDGNTVWVHIPGGIDETPVKRTINAEAGDTVQVRVAGGSAFLVGNGTNPPTDDKRAIVADKNAVAAMTKAVDAGTAAYWAQKSAEAAQESADQAAEAAADAQESADVAHTAATNAQADATAANQAAVQAQSDADEAKASARSANSSANNALTQLAVVEDVIGTINWIASHGTYFHTSDAAIDPDKVYYVLQNGVYVPVSEPDVADISTYYELTIDQALDNFVASHMSLTNAGLWLTLNNSSYKLLVANDGIYIYDSDGHLVSTYGESIVFDSSRPQYIGGEDAYIVFYDSDNDGVPDSIRIGGDNIILGGTKSLQEVLSEVDGTLIYDHTYEIANNVASFEAHLYRGSNDVKTSYDPTQFVWYLKTEDGTTYLGDGYTIQVNLNTCGYGAEVIGKFTTTDDANALSTDGDNLTDTNDVNYTVRTSGDSVRVRDLQTTTTLYPQEKIMVVGTEDEHLVTLQTLQDYLGANLNKQVKFNTTSGWNSQVTLVSESETLYVYTDHQTDSQGNAIAGIKVGDGNAYVVDLPFTDTVMMEHIADTSVHITDSERAFWNNKVSCFYTGIEQLVFTTA